MGPDTEDPMTPAEDPDDPGQLEREAATVSARTRRGVVLDITYHQGHTPLMLACQAGNAETAVYLVDKGADPSLCCGPPGAKVWPVHFIVAAAKPTDDEVVAVVDTLACGGAEIGARTGKGNTVLHIEARRGRVNVLRALLKHRSVVMLREPADADGNTPVDIARAVGITDKVYLKLLANGKNG